MVRELSEQAQANNLQWPVVEYIWKSSDVYKSYDMIEYFLTDPDKLQMAMVDGSKLVNNDFIYMTEAIKQYFESSLKNAERLVEALKNEIQECDKVLEFNEEFPDWYERWKK